MRVQALRPIQGRHLSWMAAGLLGIATAGCSSRGAGPTDPAQNASSSPSLPQDASLVEVDVGDGLRGTLVSPGGAGPHAAVLMLHGFGSDRDEVDDMFARTAAELVAEDIASLRIDFRGSGESAGAFEDTTVTRQVADTARALAWLGGRDEIDPSRIGLLGFSLGGAVAILAAGEHAFEVNSVVVWAPVGDLEADFMRTLGEDAFDEARRRGKVTRDLGWRRVTLSRAFFDDLDQHSIDDALRQYNGPFLVIAGTDDPLARYARPLAELVDGMTVMVRDADHIFHSTNATQDPAETVIQTTVVRFSGTLKW